jgi:lipopolysaccharide transport system ATP-binding protein
MDSLLQITKLNKFYKAYNRPIDRLKEIVFRRSFHNSHHVLNDISFQLQRGESLAILGRNGAGKSTLLKCILGVSIPDYGEIKLKGRVTGLLELGSGFDPELPGLDNIKTNGYLIGMNNSEIESKREAIIQFSELGDYIYEPVKNYSSGMIMRLAFAIAIHAEPDCFIVDEALAVGDAAFQQKCYQKIKEFRSRGGALLFVSHDLNAVKMVCSRALVIEDGHVQFDGDSDAAVNFYNRIISKDSDQIESSNDKLQVFGSNKATITQVSIQRKSDVSRVFSCGDLVQIEVLLSAFEYLESVSVGFMIKDRFGQDIFGINSHHLQAEKELKAGRSYRVQFDLPINLFPGHYTLTVALHSGIHHIDECYYWQDNAISFEVAGMNTPAFSGVTYLPTSIRFNEDFS